MACIITYKGVEYTEELFEKMLVRQRFPELASYLPTQDEQLRIVDANWSIRLTDKESWGLYKDGIIYVESDEHGNVRENVLRHEVFHKIFNQYLTGPQRDAMYALKRAELGDLPFIDLEEAMAQSYQTFKIPLLRRFISFTAANLNTLEGMYEAFDKGSFSSERSKFFGERNALKIKKDFATVRNFNEAERRFFQVFKSLMTYDPKSNDRVFTFEEALDEVFRVIENDVENLKKTLTSTAQGTQAYSYAFKLMSVSNLVLLNKKSMLEHFFKG